ncbi:SDR family oxidoreductase [Streptomyces sp. NPDC054834]
MTEAKLQSLRDDPALAHAGVRVFPADVTTSEACEEVIAAVAGELGGLDVLVHSVGTNDRRPVLDTPDEVWDRIVTLNLATARPVQRHAPEPAGGARGTGPRGGRARGPGVTVEDVLRATRAVAPALEIVDSRIRDWKITLVDTVADNASSAGLVCGPWTPPAEVPDLASVLVDLVGDGEHVATGSVKEVLGHPAAAVAWPANTLAGFGTGLEPEHVVLPGTMTTAPFVSASRRVEARFSQLGPVSVAFV